MSTPVEGVPVFVGVSPRRRDRDAELQAAREHAALQASRFFHLRGEAVFYTQRVGRRSGYVKSVSIDDDAMLAERLAAELELFDFRREENGSIGRFSLPGYRIDPIGFNSRDRLGKPVWLSRIPEIPGYYVGVGSAPRTRLISDSIENADREALFAILAQLSVDLFSGRLERSVAGRGVSTGSATVARAEGELVGFYVLDRWMDADGTFFTLAVCPKKSTR